MTVYAAISPLSAQDDADEDIHEEGNCKLIEGQEPSCAELADDFRLDALILRLDETLHVEPNKAGRMVAQWLDDGTLSSEDIAGLMPTICGMLFTILPNDQHKFWCGVLEYMKRKFELNAGDKHAYSR